MATSKIERPPFGGNNFGAYIDLTNTSDFYTPTSDGYVTVGTNTTSEIAVRIYSASSDNNTYINVFSHNGDTLAVPVRKGMRLMVSDKSGSSYYARFYPLT